jgi:integrase
MGNQNDAGVFQLKSGGWGYRITYTDTDGKRQQKRGSKYKDGTPCKTKRDAINARAEALEAAKHQGKKNEENRKTISDIWNEYRTDGCAGKAYRTLQKQDSLWKNHLMSKWGGRFIDDISSAEINDYLAALYYKEGRAWRYVEGFLKMFYLLYGQAYDRDYISSDRYQKMTKDKASKITMPPKNSNEDDDVRTFSAEELEALDAYFKGTNAEMAYMLGRYCGVRISECYGLKWDHINLKDGYLIIDRQMQYQDGLIKLVKVKTKNANRKIYLCGKLSDFLREAIEKHEKLTTFSSEIISQKQTIIEDIDGEMISSWELVNVLSDGKIQTVNSMKYHSRTIKQRLKIFFKYHYLRHTYGTIMADLNTPQHLLCAQMGHGKIETTQRYYIAVSQHGIDILKENIEKL